MAKVQLLEDELINKIAAGEVVERPASVVKELVENAMDAGATMIEVSLEEGGRRLISVRDNGSGMEPDDAVMALKRHTTSKIRRAQDLFEVATMGFRGEALASISSVSRFTLQTRVADLDEGIRIDVCEGEVRRQIWTGEAGTEITIQDLFFNLPARQAFLRTPSTEYAHCFEYLQALALARPDIELIIKHNGRETLRLPSLNEKESRQWGEDILRQRFKALFPKDCGDELLYLEARDKYGSFEALISPPGHERGQAKGMHTFVNGRWVKDKALRYGLMRGYHSHLLKGRYPVCTLYVRIDPSLVDVNVHPAKAEVRFQYGSELQSLLSLNIRDRLRKGAWANPEAGSRDVVPPQPAKLKASESFESLPQHPQTDEPLDFDLSFSEGPRPRGNSQGASSAPKARTKQEPFVKETTMSFNGLSLGQRAQAAPSKPVRAESESFTIPWDELNFIGTYAKCYLIFEFNDYLLLIDQHAFHERILFEKLCQDQSLLGQIQPLLVPEVVDLAPSHVAYLQEHRENFERLGFQLEFVSEQEVEVRAMPSLLSKREPEMVLRDFLVDKAQLSSMGSQAEIAHQQLSTMACHAAVRSGEDLAHDDLAFLLREAKTIDFYHNCPHGRRVFKWWKKSQVESWFDR